SAGLVLVFLMTRAAPRPTLFPYTTLFRSQHPAHRVVRPVRRQHPVRHVGQGEREEQRPSRLGQATRGHAAPDVALHDPRHAAVPDRKSTRLNSSHVKISYAVFCLKKKTHT